ncbi:MAG: glycosyltransferase family 39 protein [Chloroflexi bacterium]|nr:glycosyltransferase family 39 protein [Chloroflexota bacterium]MCI0648271.1 glycosyltransferase family 39 protein [Chloroflexota bacterium]MCI0728463.1 glycosyltransferase family 39 protein [Chloroflexota bacterium]
MRASRLSNDLAILIVLALARLALHALTNGQYGFHRDELAVLDDARHLAWGYVAYPPVTPFIGRIALELFGPSLAGLRFFAALAQSVAMILAGLMARELGGRRWAVVVAALATAIAPMSLIMGALFQYISFDYLWWVLVAYLMIRLLKSDDPRWWLAIGATLGLGLMTKYTIAFYIAGLVAGVVLTPARRYLKSPWLWAGVALSLLIFLPNLLWQIQHNFISLEFLSSIHARDVEIGRSEGFLVQQPIVNANPLTLPLWIAGLYTYFRAPAGARYRPLGWMYLVPLVLMAATQSRFYYLAPAYPMLLAAGTVFVEQWLATKSARLARLGRGLAWAALAAGAAIGAALMLPIAPINSGWWNTVSQVHDNFVEQIGWPELVETVAGIYAAQSAEEEPQPGILAGNYGEAGAINLYGPDHGLPEAISGINSYWLRGYGDPPPQTVIVLGFSRERAERFFTTCELAGRVTNRYGVENEETLFHPNIFLCRGPRRPWPDLWPEFRSFG